MDGPCDRPWPDTGVPLRYRISGMRGCWIMFPPGSGGGRGSIPWSPLSRPFTRAGCPPHRNRRASTQRRALWPGDCTLFHRRETQDGPVLAAISGNAVADGVTVVRQGPADHQLIKTGPGGFDAMDDFITMRCSKKAPPGTRPKVLGFRAVRRLPAARPRHTLLCERGAREAPLGGNR